MTALQRLSSIRSGGVLPPEVTTCPSSPGPPGGSEFPHARHHVSRKEPEKALLVGADLVDVDVVEARLDVLADRARRGARRRDRRPPTRDVVLGDQFGRRPRSAPAAGAPGAGALDGRRWPDSVGRLAGARLVLAQQTVTGRSAACPRRRLRERLRPCSAVGRRGDEPVAEPPGELGRCRAAGGDDERRRLLRQRVEAGVLDGVVARRGGSGYRPPRAAGSPRSPPRASACRTSVSGQRVTEDVLVEVLARADAEEEAAGHHRRGRRRGLRDDRRVDARIVGQVTPCRAEAFRVAWAIAPMTLQTNGLCPWRRSRDGSGPRWSRSRSRAPPPARVPDEIRRPMLLAGELVADLQCHAPFPLPLRKRPSVLRRASSSRARVLIADGDANIREVLRLFLVGKGYLSVYGRQ